MSAGDIQASVRAVTGTAWSYEGDWHALFDLAAIPAGDFDGRLLAWINLRLTAAYTNINDAMAAFGYANGASSFQAMSPMVGPNLLTAPNNFANAAWIKGAAGVGSVPIVTANAGVAPDGTNTATQITLNNNGGTTGGDESFVSQAAISTVTSSVYSGRVWMKGTLGQKLLFRHVGGGAYLTHTFTGGWDSPRTTETAAGVSSSFLFELRGGFGLTAGELGTVIFLAWNAHLQLGGMYP
jgi:hypothetical protein